MEPPNNFPFESLKQGADSAGASQLIKNEDQIPNAYIIYIIKPLCMRTTFLLPSYC